MAPQIRFRLDIAGLRAVAVALVVLYHAGVPGPPGGYVGVDAFFVISGFLMTELLTKELRVSGRVRLGAFYARRVRRLIPAGVEGAEADTAGHAKFFRQQLGHQEARDHEERVHADVAARPARARPPW